MKNSGGNWKKITKYLLVILVAFAAIFGLTKSKSIMTQMKRFFAAGDVPAHEKTRTDNKVGDQKDGTYKIGLTVKGDAEKKVQKVNVIVIVDRSNSMDSGSGTGAYVASNDNATTMYGFIDGEYRPLERRTSGWGYYQTVTYYYDNVEFTGQRYIYDTTASRLEATKAAVNGLASTLLSNNGKDGNPNDTVEMALVTFASTAQTNIAKTSTINTYVNAVNGISTPGGWAGGTNWEAALDEANDISFGDTDPTYVIFFSDGAPTFRNTQAGFNDRDNRAPAGVYGSGQEEEPNMERAYDQAKDDAATLASKVGVENFYTIFAYGETYGATYMTNLTTAAGAPAGNNYSASNTVELEEAFAQILSKIEMAGIGAVEINDGTTNKVSTSTGVVSLLEVDESSYKYYKTNKETGQLEEWTDPENDPDLQAKLQANGTVKWDLSKLGVLENDVTYKVTFDVYPSQTTYDYIAELENGTRTYESLPSEVREYLKRDTSLGTTSYTLETNTEATLKFTDTRTGVTRTVGYDNPPSVPTTSDTISIHKEWATAYDGRTARPVTVGILKTDDEGNFQNYCFRPGCNAELNESNNWSLTDIHIATGLARLEGNKLTVLDTGHDYKFDELGSEAYNWELETETVHPMIINGTLTKLILVEENVPDMGSDTYKTIDGKEYFKLDNGKIYVKSGNGSNIKAENLRRSNLNVKKNVTGENANPNDEFEFTIKVTQLDEDNKVIADDTSTNNDDIWFSICDTAIDSTCKNPNSLVMDDSLVTGAQKEMRDGAWTGYYYVPNTNTTEVKAKLKANYNIRFINLVSNTDFSVVESNKTNYELTDITAAGFSSTEGGKDGYSTSGNTITGNIGKNNTSYQIEYTNNNTNPETISVPVKKVWEDNNDQDGIRNNETITFNLYGIDQNTPVDSYTFKTTDCEGNNCNHTFTNLPKYGNGEEINYTIKETGNSNAYTASEMTKEGNTLVITNTHNPEPTEIPVKKVWNDADNQDGLRNSVTFNLYGVDKTTPINSHTFDLSSEECSDNECSYTFTKDNKEAELPKYEPGKVGVEINYSVEEVYDSDYYTASNPTKDENGNIVITNSHTPFETEISVLKIWNDDDNRDNARQPIEVVLTAGQLPDLYNTITLSESNHWTDSWAHLQKFMGGNPIEYTVTELTKLEGYTSDGVVKITPAETDLYQDNVVEYTITNNRIFDTVKIPVKKVWEDANNQDGIRKYVTFELYADGTKVAEYTFEAKDCNGNECTFEFTKDSEGADLPKYKHGEVGVEVEYTIKETNLPEGYDASTPVTEADGTRKITNTHTPEPTTIPVKKIWNDANNQDGKRQYVTFELYGAAGAKVAEHKFEAKDCSGNECTYEFIEDSEGNALPKYEPGKVGQEINYTIKETGKPNGYTSTGPTENDPYTITNTYSPEATEIPVKKIWEDADNQDGKRQYVTFELYGAAGAKVAEHKFEAKDCSGNTCTFTFKTDGDGISGNQLPKYEPGQSGQEIAYTIKETNLPDGYDNNNGKVTKDGNTLVITNTHEPETTEIPVKKVWNDANDQDGIRDNETITFNLYGVDKENAVATYTFKTNKCDNNACTYTFTEDSDKNPLPKYSEGEEINYTITETNNTNAYTPSEMTKEGNTLVITNTHNPEPTKVPVKKVWNDADDQDGIRKNEEITFELYGAAGAKVAEHTFEAKDCSGNECTFEFTKDSEGVDLPKYEPGQSGQIINYTIKEIGNTNAYTVGEMTKEGDTLVITNTHEPDPTTIPVKKIWDDANNQDGKRQYVTFELYGAAGAKVAEHKFEAKDCSGNECTYEFIEDSEGNALPKYEPGKVGQEINYTIKETGKPNGYTSTGPTENDPYTITNTYSPEATEIPVKKIWEDADNQDGKRQYVTFELYGAAGAKVAEHTFEAKDCSGNTCTFTFKTDGDGISGNQLPKYEPGQSGQEIEYTIKETGKPDVYDASKMTKEGDTLVITNTHDPEPTEIPVKKVWNDKSNQDGLRDKGSVTFNLYGVSKETSVASHTFDLSSDECSNNECTFTFKTDGDGISGNQLPKYANGQEISYTVEEVYDSDYYTASNPTKDENGNIVITNSHTPFETEISVLKIWNDDDNRDNARQPIEVVLTAGQLPDLHNPITLSESNHWTDSWTHLQKFMGGNPIEYTVTELTKLKGYTSDGVVKITPAETDLYQDNVVEYTITNNRIFDTVKIPVKKVWEDANNQDGIRKYVTFELYADGTKVAEHTFEAKDCNGNECTFEFTKDSEGADLPKYKHGEVGVEVEYTIKETNLPDGYTSTGPTEEDPYTITNTHEPSTITIPVKKVWNDAGDQDGIRDEETITFELYGAGGAKVAEYTFPTNQCTNNECTYTFTEDKDGNALPEYQPGAQGQKINYRIEETGNSKQYTASEMTTENDDTLVITNTHNPEPTTVKVKKVWEDNNNQDGKRRYVTFELYGTAGAKVASHTFVEDDCTGNICTFEFKTDGDGITGNELPKYEPGQSGQEVQYTIKETGLPEGYDNNNGKVTTDDAGNLTITNTHTPAKVNVPVVKQWVDDGVKDYRPESITVQLYADGKPVEGKTATITPKTDEQGNEVWEYEFKDLEKYEAGQVGHQIDYTVRETVVPTGYTVTYEDGDKDDGTTIINTANETIKKNIPVEKVWDDLTNIEGIRPDSVTFKLVGRVGEEEVVEPYTTTIYKPENDTNNTARSWIGEFKDVQVFFNGKLINYTLEEVTMDKSGDRYSVDIQGNDKDGYTVTNTSRPETIDFTATKKWNDDDDNDGKRPTQITVQLMKMTDAGGEAVGDEVTLSAEDWSYTWKDLDQFEEGKQGVKIKYYIVETTEVEGYTPSDYDFETNSITNNHEPITISYKVEKIWDDFDNQDGKRPNSITVRLVGKVNGEVVVPEKVQKIDSTNNWTYEFKNLPKYYKKQLIQYTITEDEVSLYDTAPITQVNTTEDTTSLSNNVTNKHELIPYDNTGKITVKKIWKDRDNKFKTRPTSITIHLFADGVEIKKAVLNASNNWTYTFTGLNKYKEGAVGVEVVYTITEDAVKGYNSSIDGFVVTNTMTETEIVPPKTGVESTNSDNTLFYVIAIVLTTLGVTTITFRHE